MAQLSLMLIMCCGAAAAFGAAQPVVSDLRRRFPRARRAGAACLVADASAGGTLDAAALAGLDGAESEYARWLASEEMGQAHLFEGWELADAADKRRLLSQLSEMDARYPEDSAGRRGLRAYVAHARDLLAESSADKNPFEGCTVDVPEGERLQIGSASFREDERRGQAAIQDAVFELVAGGLGERLGFDGIKVELPAETLSEASFLQTYMGALMAMVEGSARSDPPPLVIMTSEDTHEKTLSLLEAEDYFGFPKECVHFIKQSNVPALADNHGAFVLESAASFDIQTKPGSVSESPLCHFVFLPLTAALRAAPTALRRACRLPLASPAALGASERLGLQMNSLAVPRTAGEAAGAICKLREQSGRELVINVEYNQLDALLRTSGGGGDVADASGNSPYPGNVNTIIFELGSYAAALETTGGSMPEFVNPKYANAERTAFKKPTRLECMMQDFPKLLPPDARVGFTSFERWFSFSPVKNNIADARASAEKGVYAASPGAGEAAVYAANAQLLRLAGAQVADATEPSTFLNLPLNLFPAIALTPRFALTLDQLASRVPGGAAVSISARSALILDGHVTLESLHLDGGLSIRAAPGVRVTVREAHISNVGVRMVPIAEDDPSVPKAVSIRGYRPEWQEGCVKIDIREEGEYELTGNGECCKL